MARVRDVVISLGLPCVSAVLLMAQAAAAQTCAPASSTPGSLDTCFGVNGYVQTDVTGIGDIQAGQFVRVLSDGKDRCWAAASQRAGSHWHRTLPREVHAGGLRVSTRRSVAVAELSKTPLDGRSTTDNENDEGSRHSARRKDCRRRPDSCHLAEGQSIGSSCFASTSTGRWIRSFGTNGLATFGFPSGDSTLYDGIARRDSGSGRIVVAGQSGSVLAVARLTPSGGSTPRSTPTAWRRFRAIGDTRSGHTGDWQSTVDARGVRSSAAASTRWRYIVAGQDHRRAGHDLHRQGLGDDSTTRGTGR